MEEEHANLRLALEWSLTPSAQGDAALATRVRGADDRRVGSPGAAIEFRDVHFRYPDAVVAGHSIRYHRSGRATGWLEGLVLMAYFAPTILPLFVSTAPLARASS